jgi:alpha-galactosidase
MNEAAGSLPFRAKGLLMKIRFPDLVSVYTEEEIFRSRASSFDEGGISFRAEMTSLPSMKIFLTASDVPLKYAALRWNFTEEERRTEPVKILGDHWERAYGDLAWRGIEPERTMPWYMLVSDGSDRNPDFRGRHTEGFGVKVRPRSIVTWQYDGAGVTMWADVRNGGAGVLLSGRTLEVCEILFRDYRDMSAFEAGRRFCREMSPCPRLPSHPVYGSNNWYYAYGVSSHDDIVRDTEIVAGQCRGLENIPYMVIDDGWQKHNCDAPWTETKPVFPDMKGLADKMRGMGVRPGIWVRYLVDEHREIAEAKDSWRLERDGTYLDPSNPEVLDYVKRITRMIVNDWGYELIKHDYSTFDLFGTWGVQMRGRITKDGWHFFDRTKTSAEVVTGFYEAVREAAGDECVIIGCNVIGHLCAGLYELNRTGDDTSGQEWERTRKMGVNTLSHRLIQNGAFFMADADCVGILGPVPWEKNRLWLDVLSRTGSPLFVSCKPGILNEEQMEELRAAWALNSIQKNTARPVDWMENQTPSLWEIDGETVRYDWYLPEGVQNFNP